MSAKRWPSTFLNMRLGTRVLKSGVPGTQIEVEEAVVVEVAEVASHRGENQVQAGFLGLVLESLPSTLCQSRFDSRLCGWPFMPLTMSSTRIVEAGGEDVEPAVVVVVPRPARKADLGPVDAHRLGDIVERAVAIVVIKPGGPFHIVDEQVRVIVVVEVDPVGTLAVKAGIPGDAGLGG